MLITIIYLFLHSKTTIHLKINKTYTYKEPLPEPEQLMVEMCFFLMVPQGNS